MIGLVILGSLVTFGIMVFLFYRYLMAVSSVMMGSKEENKEIIINTGRVPHRWVRRKIGKNSPFIKCWLKRRCIRKINRLIRYYSHTSLISTEEERSFVLKALRDVREAWRENELEDILLPSDPFAGPYLT